MSEPLIKKIRHWRKEYGVFGHLSGESLNEMDAVADQLEAALKAAGSELQPQYAAAADWLLRHARSVPVGHENPVHGQSTFNWLSYAANLLRSASSVPPQELKAAGSDPPSPQPQEKYPPFEGTDVMDGDEDRS